MTELFASTATAGSPEWWLARLSKKLDDRRELVTKYDKYYRGTQPLAFMSAQFVETFGRSVIERFGSNFMALVVDAHRQRLQVQGFRFGAEPQADDLAWRIWQANNLDAESQVAHTESLVKGVAYTLTWLERGQDLPTITIEDPLEMIVESAPGNRRNRLAALKRWQTWDGRLNATLYLPDHVYKYESQQRAGEFSVVDGSWFRLARWDPRRVEGEPWPLENPIGVVPVVPIPNRPRLTGDGESEIATLMSLQDVMNKELADLLTASEFVAFPQRWMTGYDVPLDTDGNPIPIEAAANRLWMFTPAVDDRGELVPNQPEVKLGQFPAADLTPYTKVMDTITQHIGSQSQTPYHYLLPQSGQPPSGESLKSAETGLEAKVSDSKLHKGEAWEETIRVAFAWLGDDRSRVLDGETIWRPSEAQSESEHTDALIKLKALNLPDEYLWERNGMSPQEIRRVKRMQARARLEAAAFPPASPAVVPAPAGGDGANAA